MARNIKVIKNEEAPETPEVLAESIIKIATSFEALMSTNLVHQKTIVALLRDMPGTKNISRQQINLVLDNLKKLKSYYVK